MELFAKIVNSIKPLRVFAQSSILDVCQYSEYAFDIFKKAVSDKLWWSSVTIIVEYVNDDTNHLR